MSLSRFIESLRCFALRLRDRALGYEPRLYYRIYGQDGRFVYMTCKDTRSMRLFVEWVRRHDRHTIHGDLA